MSGQYAGAISVEGFWEGAVLSWEPLDFPHTAIGAGMLGSSWLIAFAIFADPFVQLLPANEPETYEFDFISVKGARKTSHGAEVAFGR